MFKKVNIILTDHDSKTPAGFHHDLRLQNPKNKNIYLSWAFKKLPKKINEKINGVITKPHTSSQAYYNSKSLKVVFKSKVAIIKQSDRAFVFVFMQGKYRGQKWILFKYAKSKKIWLLFRGKDYEDLKKL